MANDRLMIVCNVCGNMTCLYKYYPGDGSYLKDTAGGWINEHAHVCGGFKGDLHPYQFSLYTEDLFRLAHMRETRPMEPPRLSRHRLGCLGKHGDTPCGE